MLLFPLLFQGQETNLKNHLQVSSFTLLSVGEFLVPPVSPNQLKVPDNPGSDPPYCLSNQCLLVSHRPGLGSTSWENFMGIGSKYKVRTLFCFIMGFMIFSEMRLIFKYDALVLAPVA